MSKVLNVFARYPEPGKCKTRLIEALGAPGAAQLHEQMTLHTLTWARQLFRDYSVETFVHFTGASTSAMSQKFGMDLNYRQQADGDLGEKLRSATESSFVNGAERILIVGTDCPELHTKLAHQAFELLRSHDICFAPATDGGYTMLGIARPTPEQLPTLMDALFCGIPWGTANVLERSLTALKSFRVGLLKTCSDVDLPADIPAARKVLETSSHTPRLSVIIPVYGYEPQLRNSIDSAREADNVEIILAAAPNPESVSAGHRVDPHTLSTAVATQSQLVVCRANRADQMNLGAAQANSATLLFLHADTLLPTGFSDAITTALNDRRYVGGAFRLGVDCPRFAMRCVEMGVQLRTQLLKLPYGDQAIFVRKKIFHELGSYPKQPIMEDYELIRRMKKLGRLAILHQKVVTSARRWERLGVVQTTIKNQLMIAGYHLGVPLTRLSAFYRGRRPLN